MPWIACPHRAFHFVAEMVKRPGISTHCNKIGENENAHIPSTIKAPPP